MLRWRKHAAWPGAWRACAWVAFKYAGTKTLPHQAQRHPCASSDPDTRNVPDVEYSTESRTRPLPNPIGELANYLIGELALAQQERNIIPRQPLHHRAVVCH